MTLTDLVKGGYFTPGTPHIIRKTVMKRMRILHPETVTIEIDNQTRVNLKLQASANPNGCWFYGAKLSHNQLNTIVGRRVAISLSAEPYLIISDLGFTTINVAGRRYPFEIDNNRLQIIK